MDMGPGPAVTWEQIMLLARSLENAALHNRVSPEQGSRIVQLVLEFDRNIVGTEVRKAKPSRPPPATSTG